MAEAAPPDPAPLDDAAAMTLRDVSRRHCWIHDDAIVSPHAIVGTAGEWHGHPSRYPAIIEADAVIRELARVHAGCTRPTRIGARTLVMSGAHVGHDAQIGTDCDIAPNAVVGGCVAVGDRVKIGMNASIVPGCTVGAGARIGAGAVVTTNVPPGETWVGVPAKRVGPKFDAGASA